MGLRLSLGLTGGGQAPGAWVLRDSVGAATWDVDFTAQRYYLSGRTYPTLAAWKTAIGATSPGGSDFDLGPVVTGSELATNGDFAAGTANWTAGTNATISVVSGALRVTNGGGGTKGYGYQGMTTVVGRRYALTVSDVGAGAGQASIGTTAGGAEILALTDLTDNAAKTFYFTATATTTYVNLAVNSTTGGVARDFDNVSLKQAVPFVGFNPDEGTLVTWFTTGIWTGVEQEAFRLDDSTNNERIVGSRPNTTITFAVVDGGVSQAILSTLNVGEDNTETALVGAWKADDFAASVNGAAAVTDTAGTLPSISRLRVNPGQLMTIQRMAYFPRRITNVQAANLFPRQTDRFHILGDSFANTSFLASMRNQMGVGKITLDGVGGSTLTQQAARFDLTPAYYGETLLIMDGGVEAPLADAITAIDSMVAHLGHNRWFYIEPTTAEFVPGSAGRIERDDMVAGIVAHVGAAHYIECLPGQLAANDGSANDLADVANNIVPRSERSDTVHENQHGADIRAAIVAPRLVAEGLG